MDIDVAIGEREVALASLFLCFEGDDAAFYGGQVRLLSGGEGRRRSGQKKEEQRQAEEGPERGWIPCMEERIQASHVVNENSSIA